MKDVSSNKPSLNNLIMDKSVQFFFTLKVFSNYELHPLLTSTLMKKHPSTKLVIFLGKFPTRFLYNRKLHCNDDISNETTM